MHYLEKWFKHNGLFIALSTLVASFTALYSVKLFLLLVALVGWMLWRRLSIYFIVFVCCWSFFCFIYFEGCLIETYDAPTLPIELKWTERYKINGDEIRGFMVNDEGLRIYVVYELKSEKEKADFLKQSLVGKYFFIEAALWEDVTEKPNPHEYSFSMAKYLKSQNAIGTLRITNWHYVRESKTLAHRLAHYRYGLNQHIEKTFPESLAAEAQALIFGDQQHVDETLNRAYQKLGITHLFAISGLHVVLLSLFLYEVLIRCRIRIELAQTIVVIALPIYAVLAGGAPSVWRAVLLVEILFVVKMLKGRIGLDDALAAAFTLSVLWQPAIVLQVGFQLSYIACWSLIYGQRFLQQKYWWQQGFVMTLLCQLLAYPILLFHFYEISLSSFLANIVFVPLFSFIILPINVGLFVITLISPLLAKPLFTLYEPLRQLLTELILAMQAVPYQLWVPGKPTTFEMGLLIISVIGGFIAWENGRKVLATLVIVIPACLFSMKYVWQSDMEISFVDVGQGDCIVIEMPRRRAVYVIDSGGVLRFGEDNWRTKNGQYEVGTQVVVPFLKGKGISSIDSLIISHADADHVEGAEEIMREIRLNEIHITPNSVSVVAMQDLRQEAAKQGVPIVEKLAGDNWHIGKARFTYLWPTETVYEGNNDSLVLQLQYGSFFALFTGDLEEAGEKQLIKAGKVVPQTILKAGHHGSKTSSSDEFIEATSPKLTIFMAGKNNRFNHPNPEIVERFISRGLPTLSTKDLQTIVVKTDGQNIRVFHD